MYFTVEKRKLYEITVVTSPCSYLNLPAAVQITWKIIVTGGGLLQVSTANSPTLTYYENVKMTVHLSTLSEASYKNDGLAFS